MTDEEIIALCKARGLRTTHCTKADKFGYDILIHAKENSGEKYDFIVTWEGKFYVTSTAFSEFSCTKSEYFSDDGENLRIKAAEAGPFDDLDVALAAFWLLFPS